MNLGADWALFKGFLITQFPETIFSILTGSLMNGQKITFVFWFFSMGISIYILTNSLYPQAKFWIFRLSASVFYMYNFFILQAWLIAERAKFSIFIALPLGLLILYKTLNKEYSILKGTILFSLLFFFFNGGGSPPLFGSILLTYALALLYLTSINFINNGLKEILFSLRLILLFSIGFLLVNAYWILPQTYLMLQSYSSSLLTLGGTNGVLDWVNEISKYASITNILRLQGIAEWYDNPIHPYSAPYLTNPVLVVFSFVPIALIIIGSIFLKTLKDKNAKLIFLFYIFLIVGIFFTAGSHPPLGFLYNLFIKHVPGFAIFRSPFYKFGELVWFSTIFLTAYYVSLSLNKFIKRRVIKNIMGCIFIAFILIYHSPFFTTNFFIWNTPFTTKVKIPNYVTQMSDYINSQTQSDSRILLLPLVTNDAYAADGYKWGYWGLDPLPELTINRSIIARAEDNEFGIPANIYKATVNKKESAFLHFMETHGIGKILWRDDILYSDKTTSAKDFLKVKENLQDFRSINLERNMGEWSLYSIDSPNILPPVYISKSLNKFNLELIRMQKKSNLKNPYLFISQQQNKQNLNSPVLFRKINPTKYIANVKNAKDKYVLVFNQAFNPNWKAYADNDNLENNHVVVNGYVNGWIIDKKGDYEITIEYAPQNIAYIGTFISAVSLLSGILIYFGKIKRLNFL